MADLDGHYDAMLIALTDAHPEESRDVANAHNKNIESNRSQRKQSLANETDRRTHYWKENHRKLLNESHKKLFPGQPLDSDRIPQSVTDRCKGFTKLQLSGEGSIDGEVTDSCLQMVMRVMLAYLDFGKTSIFLDIGSGKGEVVAHASQYPRCKLSIGIENEPIRHHCAIRNILKLDEKASKCAQQDGYDLNDLNNVVKPKVVLIEDDLLNLKTFTPCTHVYGFDCCYDLINQLLTLRSTEGTSSR
jgi:tRNA G46 methylase TrmB